MTKVIVVCIVMLIVFISEVLIKSATARISIVLFCIFLYTLFLLRTPGREKVKLFPPNTVIARNFSYQDIDFISAWKTDDWGFKNNAIDRNNLTVVAIGDSFTEGVGVGIDDTWCSQLTLKGKPTYNLGIQGASPADMESIYKSHIDKLNTKVLLICYCGGTFVRNRGGFVIIKKRLMYRNFQNIVRDAREKGIQPILVYLQHLKQEQSREDYEIIDMGHWAEKNNLPFIVLPDRIARNFFIHDGHMNKKGHSETAIALSWRIKYILSVCWCKDPTIDVHGNCLECDKRVQ